MFSNNSYSIFNDYPVLSIKLKLIHFLQLVLFAGSFLLGSCNSSKKARGNKVLSYDQIIESSPTFDRAFTGFMLFDPASGDTLYQRNAKRYFTPASNTKIFTFYTCLQILGDSMPGIHYLEKGDSLIFWGTGDPSLRNPYLSENNLLIDFLKGSDKQLFYNPSNFKDTRFGSGWSWDDAFYYYQPEKSAMPYHGNVIKVNKTPIDTQFQVTPEYFSSNFFPNKNIKSRYLKRVPDQNRFEYNPIILANKYDSEHPFLTSDELLIKFLRTATSKNIQLLADTSLSRADTRLYYTAHMDTLYGQMMQASDNFIAEQLLLACSNQLFGNLNTDQAIQYAIDSLMQNFPDEPIWADGSGLSRYNLFTPRTIVHLLHQLYLQIPKERLLHIFPAGGISGTIKNWYGGKDGPYVFAKTGTLSNNHCLSGYLIADSGRLLIFSFMHNNYKGGSTPFKKEMQKVLESIKKKY
jgi:D-alanyl-D-alanine carboxypeptidase/D-alanyl-D-alanine-endopeptidase (penicillin-binding protein 4)